MDSCTMNNYQTSCDFSYDTNNQGYVCTEQCWINELETCEQDFPANFSESDPAIHDFINLLLPQITGQMNNSEFQAINPQQPDIVNEDSWSDNDSVIIGPDDLRGLPCSRQDYYAESLNESSVGSGHFDIYQPPQIPSPDCHIYNNPSLPPIDYLLQTTRQTSSTQRPCTIDDEEDDEESEAIVKKGKRGAKNILLWKFLLDELADAHQKHIRWISCKEGTFRFVDTAEISKMWGAKKRKNDMNFEKLSRGIRHYYKSGFMRREDGTRLVYKFNWKKVPKEYRRRFAL
ncbi:uncharacterized protein [Argopecten irradians]|uniref:uncharacterized protein isoform X2 n=1 Tax=Argopecten irradians TaxID=31199 RepID=UPI003714D820